MTEAEWLASTDPETMIEFKRGTTNDRKLRLFACSCLRQVHSRVSDCSLISDELFLAERFCDGLASSSDLRFARSQLGARGGYSALWAENNVRSALLEKSAVTAARSAIYYLGSFFHLLAVNDEGKSAGEAKELSRAAVIQSLSVFRDIFGNPFRSVTFAPEWRTAAAVALAESMYQARDFGAMPVLADALQDAGCEHEDILSHCRGPGPHVRGCWVVDLVTGRE